MISKRKITQRTKRKTNSDLAKAITLAKKQNLIELARKLALPRRQQIKINIEDLNNIEEKEIIVPGKVLGKGDINKKILVYALGFSEAAREILKKAGCETKIILNGLENKKLKGVKII